MRRVDYEFCLYTCKHPLQFDKIINEFYLFLFIDLSTIFRLENRANQIALTKTGLVTTFSPLHSRPTK